MLVSGKAKDSNPGILVPESVLYPPPDSCMSFMSLKICVYKIYDIYLNLIFEKVPNALVCNKENSTTEKSKVGEIQDH